jgi:thiamine-phosphate pyrophosphorylase
VSWAPSLYLITDRRTSPRPLPEQIALALEVVRPGSAAVQLREKDLSARELLALGRALLPVCRARGAALLINDRLDVALALGADGAHLSGTSLPASEARKLLGPSARIGVSCHSVEEVRERSPGADFATWGPVFATASKQAFGPPVGTRDLPEALKAGTPLVALGGVNASNAAALSGLGFSGVACIGAVNSAQNPGEAARALARAFAAG